jgi:MFS family permease
VDQKFQETWETTVLDSPVREKSSLRDWYTLAVLIVAYVLSFVDRQILSILVEPLKHDLHLSDTEVSLLQGLVFAVFLALAGLPLGRLVDTRRRVTIVAAGITAWSIATASCAFASSYPMFLLCRMGVGVGEATLTPASHSIVADSVPRARLGFALGVFGVGSYIGSGVALLIGAGVMAWLHGNVIGLPMIGSLKSWQSVFLIVGLPGLLIAGWAATLREPRRRGVPADNSLSKSWAVLRDRFGSLLALNFTAALTAMAVYAMGAWVPSFLIRSFGWSAPQAGMAYGLVVIGCGIAGVVGGGALGDLAVARGLPAGRLMVMTAASLCAAPFSAAAMLAVDGRWSVALLVPATLLTTITLGILPSAQQAIVPGQVRGITASLGVLMVNVIGLGIGPTVIALVTDFGLHDPKLIRYALASVLPVMLIASALMGLISIPRYGRTEKHAGAD